jgi:periplasmic divalent cation tolerance protein
MVLTTLGAEADAAALARTLVNERLAACVNILPPMISVYRWRDRVEEDREQQLLIKTSPACLEALEAKLKALHPYEVPEFLVLPVEGGTAAYLDWLRDAVGANSRAGHTGDQ